MLETGITWAPSPELLESDIDGATEHVARHFAIWVQSVMKSIHAHNQDPATVEARERSGSSYRQHGLTAEHPRARKQRRDARRDYDWPMSLQSQLAASKGTGTGKAKGKGRGGAAENAPRAWADMSWGEQWWLGELWNGNLKRKVQEAEQLHGGRVQAHRFRVSK